MNIHALRELTADGLAIGRGAASSLVSALRDSHPSFTLHSEVVLALLEAATRTAAVTSHLLDTLSPDVVYVFNGRYAESLPVVQICQQRNIQLWSHDLGYEPNTFRLVPNDSVHNLEHTKSLITLLWDRAADDEVERASIARSFFDGRRRGGPGNAEARYQWTRNQRDGWLPDSLREHGVLHRVGIFVSSEDEMTALDEYRNPVYRDQLEALDAIVTQPWPTTTRLFVRSHPNLLGLDNTQTRAIGRAASHDRVTVIPPESPVDTYGLVEACDVVVTFGSTVGIEAAYWGTPSVLIGRAEWEQLGVHRPTSHEEAIRQISAPGTQHADPLPFGFMQRTWGIPFTHYEPWPRQPTSDERLRVVTSTPALVRSRIERFIDTSGGVMGRIAGSAGQEPDPPMPFPGQQLP